MQSVLVIDNYDSFTYNLVHYLEALNCKVSIMRNDEIDYTIAQSYHKIILSPGPGLPEQAGELNQFLKKYSSSKSILGICLGQQALVNIFQGKLKPLRKVKHGKMCNITHNHNDILYKNIPESFEAGLYFSWEVTDLPEELICTSQSEEGIIMSIKHKQYDIKAVQYHPESIMTPYGKQIIKNWIEN